MLMREEREFHYKEGLSSGMSFEGKHTFECLSCGERYNLPREVNGCVIRDKCFTSQKISNFVLCAKYDKKAKDYTEHPEQFRIHISHINTP